MSAINFLLYFLCLCLSGAGAWLITRYGHRLDLLDKPNARSSHRKTTPKGGGIGILAAFLVGSITLSIPKSFWIPAALLSFFSLWGDRSDIRPRTRLLYQFAAGVTLLLGVLWEKGDGLSGYAFVPPLAVFVVGTANFYNFMDGINGIAGVTGVIGFGLLSWLAADQGADSRIIHLCFCMSFACLGFLPLNMPKAKVFAGDVGSILLGFLFAGIVAWLSKNFLDFICAAACLFTFYADELTTLIVRIKDGDRLTRPHRKHLYQLLANELGIAHWKISVAYGGLQLFIGGSILLMRPFGIHMVLAILCIYFVAFLLFSASIRKKSCSFC